MPTPPTPPPPGTTPPTTGSRTSGTAGAAGRESAVIAAFVELSDAQLSDSDTAETLARLVQRCVDLLGVTAAGILLPDRAGQLAVLAASSSEQHTRETLQLHAAQGPCLDCVRTGQPVLVPDLTAAADTGRWPRWAPRALAGGVRSANALPMHLDNQPIGALNLVGDRPHQLTDPNRALGQALADVATTAVFTGRRRHDSDQRSAQLQHALHSRVIIEQAKGVLATALGTSVDDAFTLLRDHSRNTNQRITDVAAALATGRLGSDQIHH